MCFVECCSLCAQHHNATTRVFDAGIPLLFYHLLHRRRDDIRNLGQKLQLEDERSGVITLASDLARTKQLTHSVVKFQRRPSFVGTFESLTYLVRTFENFCPDRWFCAVYLLVLRLAQTSLLTVVHSQLPQAAIMCCE